MGNTDFLYVLLLLVGSAAIPNQVADNKPRTLLVPSTGNLPAVYASLCSLVHTL